MESNQISYQLKNNHEKYVKIKLNSNDKLSLEKT